MRKVCVVIMLFFSISSLAACNRRQEPRVISDLTYCSKKQSECVVYLQEDGQFIPFLVLTDDYNGNVLLVRKEILPLPRRINEYSSFYENSEIDQYLNQEYLYTITEGKQIIASQIAITEDNALGFSGNSVKTIERKVFLLSLTEIGCDDSNNAGIEGKPLEYFKVSENRIAFCEECAASWWLRSPNTYYFSCNYGVGPDGTIGSGNSYNPNGIRPAFSMSKTTQVNRRTDIYAGHVIYVISEGNINY